VYGGPGADLIACGAGADIAFADATDKVAKDCETVRGLPAKPPAPPPPPPPPLVKPGHYASVGDNVSFDVAADGVTMSNLSVVRIVTPCQPPGLRLVVPVAVTSSITIQPDKTFAVDFQAATGLMPKLSIRGAFDGTGNVSGTLSIHVSADLGAHYECDSGAIAWTASLQQ
jgi:hypothetical protein